MATLSALMTMTKSPPSTLGVNVGLCLPRSRLAAATASRPSTTSVASMTYHERVVSPAFGVYVGTALTFSSLGLDPGDPGCRSGVGGSGGSRRPTSTRGPACIPHANGAAYLRASAQVKTPSARLAGHHVEDEVRVRLVGHIRGYLDGAVAAGVPEDAGAADDRQRNRLAPHQQRGGVSKALHRDLAAVQVERGAAGRLACLVVPADRGADAGGRAQ